LGEVKLNRKLSSLFHIIYTVKMDGNGGPMLTATEIKKAAKCLKDNSNFKSVYINPDLT
jgi:hypothetical protein